MVSVNSLVEETALTATEKSVFSHTIHGPGVYVV